MASVLHGGARTTSRVRGELQEAKAASRTLARQYGVNPKTVLKWRNRTTTAHAAMGPAKAALHNADRSRGGYGRRVSKAHVAASR